MFGRLKEPRPCVYCGQILHTFKEVRAHAAEHQYEHEGQRISDDTHSDDGAWVAGMLAGGDDSTGSAPMTDSPDKRDTEFGGGGGFSGGGAEASFGDPEDLPSAGEVKGPDADSDLGPGPFDPPSDEEQQEEEPTPEGDVREQDEIDISDTPRNDDSGAGSSGSDGFASETGGGDSGSGGSGD